MQTRKWNAALVAAAMLVGVTGTALAQTGSNVPTSVYSDPYAQSSKLSQSEVLQNLVKAGVKDVKADDWAANSIAVIVQSGLLTTDTTGSIRPEKSVSSSEGIAVFAKVLGIASKTDDPATAVAKAQQAGLVSSGSSVDRDMTRLEVAQLLSKALGIQPKAIVTKASYPFNDYDGISNEDRGILAALYEAGVFRGYEDQTFRPGNVLTRAEIAILVDRVLGGMSR